MSENYRDQVPKVGDVVHYVLAETIGPHVEAKVTFVYDDPSRVSLMADEVFMVDCRHDEAYGPGTWHWPEPQAAKTPTAPKRKAPAGRKKSK